MPTLVPPSTKKSSELTLIDKLSRLSYRDTVKLLGIDGTKLLRTGDKWTFQIAEDVYLGEDLFRLKFPPEGDGNGESAAPVVVTITLMAESRDRLHWNCTSCDTLCEHVGAAFSLILDEKMALGLAAPPTERVPIESLGEEQFDAAGDRGAARAGANGADDDQVGGPGTAVDRLHRDEHAVGQDLPRGRARARAG